MKCIYLRDNLPQSILFFNINKINILNKTSNILLHFYD